MLFRWDPAGSWPVHMHHLAALWPAVAWTTSAPSTASRLEREMSEWAKSYRDTPAISPLVVSWTIRESSPLRVTWLGESIFRLVFVAIPTSKLVRVLVSMPTGYLVMASFLQRTLGYWIWTTSHLFHWTHRWCDEPLFGSRSKHICVWSMRFFS